MPFERAALWMGLLIGMLGCARTLELRAVITDSAGRPIPGAVFYAEVWKHPGTMDFAFARAGPSGEVPARGAPPLKLLQPPGGKLALAAFAPGKKPMVILDPLGRVKADGIILPLEDPPSDGRRWEPRVAQLGFPFEDQPALAQRVASPEFVDLRAAFAAAYAPLASGEEPVMPWERAKLVFLGKLAARPDGVPAGP